MLQVAKCTVILFFLGLIVQAQNIHVRYKHVFSPIVTIYDDLFVDSIGNTISIRQEINERTNQSFAHSLKIMAPSFSVISKIKSDKRDYFYTTDAGKLLYFVADSAVPKPFWIIDEKSTKTIAGYSCKKAETIFRGRPIVAYFTPDIKVDCGPYKFYGLPGLILEVRVKNLDFYIWQAVSVDINNKSQINFSPQFPGYIKVPQKEFVKIKDAEFRIYDKKVPDILPAGTTFKKLDKNRPTLEQVYEWE